MNKPPASPLSLAPISEPVTSPTPLDPWAANTELSTRFLERGDEAQGDAGALSPTIGKAVGDNAWELFVSCAPADALSLEMDRCPGMFMLLHDLAGAPQSKAFLAEVAHHLGEPLRRLVIRRQGFGTVLATLCFVEVVATNGLPIRIYSTDVAADVNSAAAIQRELLSRSQMSVILMGGGAVQGLNQSLQDVAQVVKSRGGPASPLVFLSTVAFPALSALLAQFTLLTNVPTRQAPSVSSLMEGWPFLRSCWNELHTSAAPPDQPAHALALFPPLALTASRAPVPGALPVMAGVAPPDGSSADWQAKADAVCRLRPETQCCIFNSRTLAVLAQAGLAGADASTLARQGRMLLAGMQTSSQVLGLGKEVQTGVVILENHLLLLRPLSVDSTLLMLVIAQGGPDFDVAEFQAALERLDV
jgi:hypothetical protein